MPDIANRRSFLFLTSSCILVFLAGLFLVGLGSSFAQRKIVLLVLALVMDGFWAILWILAGYGWGVALQSYLLPRTKQQHLARMALGAGLLMAIDWFAGVLGVLSPLTAWLLGLAGWLQAMLAIYKASFRLPEIGGASWAMLAAAMPALALLFGCATIAPGVLWPREFGGWDALMYHLQLPREWMDAGKIAPLHHNVYSYLPDYMEAAFLHVGYWNGSMLAAALPVQLLHAIFAVLTALSVGSLAAMIARRDGAAQNVIRFSAVAAATLYLVSPWTLITGSMAFVEQGMMFLAAAALLVAMEEPDDSGNETFSENRLFFGKWSAVGLLCGWAVLAKINGAIMVLIPMGLVFLWRQDFTRKKLVLSGGLGFCAGAVLAILPWCARNYIWTGNPAFPMGADVLGSGHWSHEQVSRFTAIYQVKRSFPEIFKRLIQCMGSVEFGHFVLPAAAVAAAVLSFFRQNSKRTVLLLSVMALVQTVIWMFATKQVERFIAPVLIPGAVLFGLAAGTGRVRAIAALFVVFWLTRVDYKMYLDQPQEPAAAIDGVEYFRAQDPYDTMNGLPPGSRIYAEGFTTPFYVQTPIDYHTLWDRSPLGLALHKSGVSGAMQWLKENKFTHLVVDWGMIKTWQNPGDYGYDENIDLKDLRVLASMSTTLHEGEHSKIGVYALP